MEGAGNLNILTCGRSRKLKYSYLWKEQPAQSLRKTAVFPQLLASKSWVCISNASLLGSGCNRGSAFGVCLAEGVEYLHRGGEVAERQPATLRPLARSRKALGSGAAISLAAASQMVGRQANRLAGATKDCPGRRPHSDAGGGGGFGRRSSAEAEHCRATAGPHHITLRRCPEAARAEALAERLQTRGAPWLCEKGVARKQLARELRLFRTARRVEGLERLVGALREGVLDENLAFEPDERGLHVSL